MYIYKHFNSDLIRQSAVNDKLMKNVTSITDTEGRCSPSLGGAVDNLFLSFRCGWHDEIVGIDARDLIKKVRGQICLCGICLVFTSSRGSASFSWHKLVVYLFLCSPPDSNLFVQYQQIQCIPVGDIFLLLIKFPAILW